MNMNTTHFVIMNNMNTTNMINQMNMMHMMNNHHNTTETVCNITGVDMVIIIVGFILLIWGGVKVTDWLFDKTYNMKEPWDFIVFIGGIFGYVTIGLVVICLFVSLI